MAAQLLIEFKALVQLRTADGNTALQVGAPGPGADVGGVSPVPARMWQLVHIANRSATFGRSVGA